jgi:ElaB/YqjD/DUF883 family membrane-anchored ribosome-binding protein
MQEGTTEKLVQDLRVLVADAEALLAATAGQAGEKIAELRAQAQNAVNRARARLSALEDEFTTKVRDSARATDEYVRANPWRAVGIAAGAGLLLGVLLSWRRR